MSTLPELIARTRKLLLRHERQLVLFSGCILICVISYEIGFLKGNIRDNKVMVVEASSACTQEETTAHQTEDPIARMANTGINESPLVPETQCIFVGSKNSTKYHSPSCAWAKRIKVENRVCFQSREDAEKRGYVAGCIQ